MAAKSDCIDENLSLDALKILSAISVPMAMKAVLNLGIPEILSDSSMMSAAEITEKLPACKDPGKGGVHLERMMRALAAHGVFKEQLRASGVREYGLTPLCKILQFGNHPTYGPLLAAVYQESNAKVWHCLDQAVLDGSLPAFKHAVKYDPLINLAMAGYSKMDMNFILSSYNGFEGIGSLVDLGGGTGATIAAIKAKYPEMRAINFDRPHVVHEQFPGVEQVGGDILEGVIPKADAILLKRVLHCWDDEKCVTVLKKCYKNKPQKVIVIDSLMPSDLDHSKQAQVITSMDLLMLTQGGVDRTMEQYKKIGAAAGFSNVKLAATTAHLAVLEFCE